MKIPYLAPEIILKKVDEFCDLYPRANTIPVDVEKLIDLYADDENFLYVLSYKLSNIAFTNSLAGHSKVVIEALIPLVNHKNSKIRIWAAKNIKTHEASFNYFNNAEIEHKAGIFVLPENN